MKTTTYMRQGKEVTRRSKNGHKTKRKQAIAIRSGDINGFPAKTIQSLDTARKVRSERINRTQVLPNIQQALSELQQGHEMLLTGMREGTIKRVDPAHTKMLAAMHILTQST